MFEASRSVPPRFPEGVVEPVVPRFRAPRIGLALGGGSARGWSHIGVIEGLEEAGIYPEVVAGCSIGAVVGGAYAAGRIDALKDFALSLTRRRVVGMLDPRITGSGLIAGERLRRRLARELEGFRIEDLRLAFASVATELGTGHEVWLSRGPLVEAVRASYAIPGIFPPVALDGRLLMDGTLVNPVPVRLARELGADLVICVNLACETRAPARVIRPERDAAMLGLDGGDALLHHVADRDDADEAPVLHHRQVAETALGHRLHHILDAGAPGAGHDLLGHVVRHRPVEGGGPFAGQCPHHVALGQNADHATSGIADHEGTDPLLGQEMDRLVDGAISRHRDHRAALLCQDTRNGHEVSSLDDGTVSPRCGRMRPG